MSRTRRKRPGKCGRSAKTLKKKTNRGLRRAENMALSWPDEDLEDRIPDAKEKGDPWDSDLIHIGIPYKWPVENVNQSGLFHVFDQWEQDML